MHASVADQLRRGEGFLRGERTARVATVASAANNADRTCAPRSLLQIDELKDRMVVRNCRKGVDGGIGGQCKETLDRAPVFLKVSLKNSGLPVVNYGDRSKPLRPASAPQCNEARRKCVLRPGRMAPTADQIPVTIHFQKVHWSCNGFSASTALNLQ